MKPDSELVADYLEGSDAALGLLVERYVDDLYRFAFSLTGDQTAAEDITQESFIKAWKHIRSFRPELSFKTWLFRIARNSAIDWLRKKKEISFSRMETADADADYAATLLDPAPTAETLLAQAEDAQFVSALLAELDPRYRDVLILRGDGLTFKEIGELLARPLDTVKSQYRRALAAVRRALEKTPLEA